MRTLQTAVVPAFLSFLLFEGFTAGDPLCLAGWALAALSLAFAFTLAWRYHLLHRRLDRELEEMGSSFGELGDQIATQTRALEFAGRQLEQQKKIIENLRMTDRATGLWARGHLDQIAAPLVARSLRNWEAWNQGSDEAGSENRDLLAFVVQLDRLPELTRSYGPEAGEKILGEFADVLRATSRSTDILARWGRERVLVLRAGADRSSARQLAERLREAVVSHIFQPLKGIEISTTCSVGFAGFPLLSHAPRALDFQAVLKLADWALEVAAANGLDLWVGVGGDAGTPEKGLGDLIGEGPERLVRAGKLVLVYSGGEGRELRLPGEDA